MATVKYLQVDKQNANNLAGVQVSSATYAGTNTGAGDAVLRVGRESPVFSIVGTQTASSSYIALDLNNAVHGATFTVKRQIAVMGTGIIDVVSGSAAGALVGRIPASANGVVVAAFDGVAQIWR